MAANATGHLLPQIFIATVIQEKTTDDRIQLLT